VSRSRYHPLALELARRRDSLEIVGPHGFQATSNGLRDTDGTWAEPEDLRAALVRQLESSRSS